LDREYEEPHEYAIAIPPSADAELRLTPPQLGTVTGHQWIEHVRRGHTAKGRTVSDVRFGEFTGVTVRFDAGPIVIRGWALSAGPRTLDVDYRCPLEIAGRDDEIVDAMLASLG